MEKTPERSETMPKVKCLQCGKSLRIEDGMIGKKGRCPKCSHIFIISSALQGVKREISASEAKPLPPTIRKESKVESTGGTSNICGRCTKEIPASATHCPHCGKLRKDIYRLKAMNYTFAIWMIVTAVPLIVGLRNGWWHESTGFFQYQFSIQKFLSSPLGIIIVIAFIGFFIGTFYTHIKVAKKLGSWFWF